MSSLSWTSLELQYDHPCTPWSWDINSYGTSAPLSTVCTLLQWRSQLTFHLVLVMSSVVTTRRFSAITLSPMITCWTDSINAGAVSSSEDALLLVYLLVLVDTVDCKLAVSIISIKTFTDLWVAMR